MSIVTDFKDIKRRLENPNDKGEEEPVCHHCNDTGYICYATGHMDPHFKTCEYCHNPKGHPCP